MTKYEEVGVDAQKEGIEVFESTIKNLVPPSVLHSGTGPR